MNKKWNVLVDENGNVNAITTKKALRQYQRQLQRQAKDNAQSLKRLLQFVPVSELEDVDLSEYLKDSKPIRKGEVNGINNLITFAVKDAEERGITAPYLCFVELDGRRYYLADRFKDFMILNSKVTVQHDFESEIYSDKGGTPFGWAHPRITEFYRKEVDEPADYDFCLRSTRLLKNHVFCGIGGVNFGGGSSSYSFDEEFDVNECKKCSFYKICNSEPLVGTTYYYITAIR